MMTRRISSFIVPIMCFCATAVAVELPGIEGEAADDRGGCGYGDGPD